MGLLDSVLGFMQDPRRTQQLQGTGRAIQQGLLNIQQSDKRFQDLFDKSFGDPKQPFKVTDKKALSELTQMTQSGLLGMAEVGMLSKAVKGLSAGTNTKPINLEKGIYKPDLTMEEMLKVKDIPTVERVQQSLGLVGEKEFEKMVNSQFKKYKPSSPEQEAMLVESVTLEILGKAQRSPFPRQEALDTAQRNAVEYPLAPAGTRYEEFGGQLTYMTPDEYLSRVRPLELDDVSLENIASLKSHVQSGGKLDPLHIYKDGKEDGRHRAYMAKELGIDKIPVALHTEANNLGQNIPMDALSLLAEQQRKQITGLLE